MQYLFADLVVLSDLQKFLTSFYSGVGIEVGILNLDGRVMVASSYQNFWDDFYQKVPQSQQGYRRHDEEIISTINEKSLTRCELFKGLFKYSHPIRLENQDIAILSLGPVVHAKPNLDNFRLLSQESEFGETVLLTTIAEIPIVTIEQIEGYLDILVQYVQHLIDTRNNELRLIEANANTQEKLEMRIQERTAELEQANAALQESDQRLRVALVDTPLVVFNQDLDLRYTWIYNPHNYGDQPIVGKTDAELFSPEEAMRLTALKKRVIGAGLLTREEVSITIGNRITYFDMTLNPLYDTNGFVTGLTCAATDITERKQIEKDIRKRLAESEGIRRIAKGLLQKIGLDDVLEIVCTEAMQLTGAKGSAVLLLDAEGWLILTHRAGSPVYTLDRLPVKGTLAGQAIQTGSLVWADRQKSKPEELTDQWHGFPWTPGLLSMLSVPLKVDAQTIGVLNILDKPGELTQEDMRIIDLFADQAAIIIEHVRLQHQSEQVAVLEERQRLARELHDSVTQALYSVNLYADASLLAFSKQHWSALENNLHEVRNMAREAMYDMRLLVFELRPLMLEQEGLISTLRHRVATVEARSGLKTEVLVEGEKRLPISIEEQIYWIAHEGLQNVVKHAKATNVQIQLNYNQDSISLAVIDDGLGFDPENISLSGGLGLQGIQERVQKSGGHLEIESSWGKGTRLVVTIPIYTRDPNEKNEITRR